MEPARFEDLDRVARAIGERPARLEPAPGHGARTNRRYIASLQAGSVFAKVAALDYTAEWLRDEHAIYEELSGRPFMPRLLGWDDDGVHPVIVLEDLRAAFWPPPWDRSRVDAVLSALDEIHATPPPAHARDLDDVLDGIRDAWSEIREDPAPVLRLGVCSEAWLARHLEALEAAARSAVLAGDAFVHIDVWSDNVCFRGSRAILIDWNWASRGDPAFDLAAWLPSLAAEGGPKPWELLPDATEFASLLAGYFLAQCVLPPIPQAPHVRPIQEASARAALPWAARTLGLPPPGAA